MPRCSPAPSSERPCAYRCPADASAESRSRRVHERGFGVEVLDGERGAVRFTRPDGRPLSDGPPPPRPRPPDPAAALVRRNRDRGLAIDAWTATPDWSGEALDLGLAIDLLRPQSPQEGEREEPGEQGEPGEQVR